MADSKGLGPRGTALWASLGRVEGTAEGELALEACRAVDLLADLHDIAQGSGVLELLRFRLRDSEGRVAEVKFDNVVSEIRQQQNNLRQILTTLGLKAGVSAPAEPKGSPLDELQAKRASRGGSAGSNAPRTTRERTAARRRR